MRTSLAIGRPAGIMLGLSVVAILWFLFAPAALGGSTTYVVTEGVSMQPRFHSGDLALVRAAGSYHVGEIVAYRSRELDTIVLHRIVGREGDRYVFKGDNNDFYDTEHPVRSQLVGKLWLHAPGAGRTFARIGSPKMIGFLVGLAALLLLGGAGAASRRRGRDRPKETAPRARQWPQPTTATLESALLVSGLGLVVFVVLGLLAYGHRGNHRAARNVTYVQSGDFSYFAKAPSGDVYPEGRARTGDTVFLRLVDRVGVRFAYHLGAGVRHGMAGTASLDAVLESSNGWQRTFVLQRPTRFTGDRTVVSGTLALRPIEALLARVETATAVGGTTYTLTVVPHVSSHGQLDGGQARATFAPELPFTLDTLQLRPAFTPTGVAAGAVPGTPPANPLTPTKSGSARVVRFRPNVLAFPKLHVRASVAGRISEIGSLLALAALLLCAFLVRRGRGGDEPSRIRARYGNRLVPVVRGDRVPDGTVVEVSSFETLVRIAERSDRMILHEQHDGGHSYRIADEGVVYVYAAVTPTEDAVPPAPPSPRTEPAPPAVPPAPSPVAVARRRPAAPAPPPVPRLPSLRPQPIADVGLAPGTPEPVAAVVLVPAAVASPRLSVVPPPPPPPMPQRLKSPSAQPLVDRNVVRIPAAAAQPVSPPAPPAPPRLTIVPPLRASQLLGDPSRHGPLLRSPEEQTDFLEKKQSVGGQTG